MIKNLEKTIQNSRVIIISMKLELLKIFRKPEFNKPAKYTFLSQILVKMSEKNTEINKENNKKYIFQLNKINNIEKFQIEKNYKNIKKKIFSWNDSYIN